MALLQYLEVPLLAIVAAPAVLLGVSPLGYGLGAGAWIVLRAAVALVERRTREIHSPLRQLGVTLFTKFGRIWLLAGAIVAAGVVGGRAAGLTAAVVVFCAFTVYFLTTLVTRGGEALRRR